MKILVRLSIDVDEDEEMSDAASRLVVEIERAKNLLALRGFVVTDLVFEEDPDES